MNFEQALAAIASLHRRKWRNGLDRMNAFIDAANLRSAVSNPNFVHVAGTNGKGSVTANLQSIFVEAGFKTGAFFSPFVVDPRERIQIGRDLIDKRSFAELTEMLLRYDDTFVFDGDQGISEFEFKTALGFAAWERFGCDWVALEVGLGGRIDATNVVTPRCSVIVSIGLDHINILGATLEEIAFEKAGVIKPGIPVVVGEMPPPALNVILARARELNSPVYVVNDDFSIRRDDLNTATATFEDQHWSIRPGIAGSMHCHNATLAAVAATLAGVTDHGAIERGISLAYIPGRFQTFVYDEKTVIVDGAHNGAAAEVLAESLRRQNLDNVMFIVGMVSGHDTTNFIQPLVPFATEFRWVPIDFYRAKSPEELQRETQTGRTVKSLAEAIASATEPVIVITGSLYLAGEAIRFLSPPPEQTTS